MGVIFKKDTQRVLFLFLRKILNFVALAYFPLGDGRVIEPHVSSPP